LAPDGGCALGLGLDQRPQPLRQALAAPGLQQHRVQSGAVHIVLALGKRAVANSHRACASVPGDLFAKGLG
jgi:hypothetical protein